MTSFELPTRAELLQRILADYRLELGADPLRRSWERAAALAQTGISKGLYGYLQFVFRQLFPDTADDFYFYRWLNIFGLTVKPAVYWQGTVDATGTNGTIIPAGSVIVRSDGVEYTVDADTEILGTTEVAITASVADSASNNDDGQPLAFSPAIAGVGTAVVVTATTETGVDVEVREDAQPRLLLRLSSPPAGGSEADYVRWATEVPGVTRCYPYLPATPNTVWLVCLRDNDGTGSAILPDSTERTEIQDYVNTLRPYTVAISVIPVVAVTVNVQISNLNPDTSAVRAAIEESLQDLFSREGEPDSTLQLSRIGAAISEATGEISHDLDAPFAPVTTAFNEVPILGTVTFV